MKLLVTGTSGFIGSRFLTAACNLFGRGNVIAFSSRPADDCQTIVYKGLEFELTARDRDLLATADVLIHLGAFIPKSRERANDIEKCNSNIIFTERLLKESFSSLCKIIYVSTSDVYEPAQLITESTPTVPVSLYGWSKLYCEKMCHHFAAEKGISCQILRIGHVYGPGEENYDKFIPKAMQSIITGDTVELWGDGSEIRSFIYIDDVVTALLKSINIESDVGSINIVGGVPISIRQILEKIIGFSEKQILITERCFSGEKRNLIFDNKKMRSFLLSEETDLNVGLQNEYLHMGNSK
jgi:UDP-glucose 4-epimerase